MSQSNKILPNILKALSTAPENQDNLANIVDSVTEDLNASNGGASQTNDVANEVKQSLQVAADLGLIAANSDNIYRLQFNPNAKLPFAIQNLANPDQLGSAGVSQARNIKKKPSQRRRDIADSSDDSDSAMSLNDGESDDSNQEEEYRRDVNGAANKNYDPVSLLQKGMLRAKSSGRRMKRTSSSNRSRRRRSSRRGVRKSGRRGGQSRRRRRSKY